MDILEKLVIKKLDKHKEVANRERFILPADKNIYYLCSTKYNFDFP